MRPDAGAVEHLVEGLSFDERSAHHCSLALYELCVGDAILENELWPPSQRPLTVQLRVQRTLTPLVAAQQRLAWAHLHLPVAPLAAQDGRRAPLGASELLSADIVEIVARWVSPVWCFGGSISTARHTSGGIRTTSTCSSSRGRTSSGTTATAQEFGTAAGVAGPTVGGARGGWLGSNADFERDEQLRVGAAGRCAHREALVSPGYRFTVQHT